MIDWIKTEEEGKVNEEYFMVFPNSEQKVYKICDKCGREGWMPYRNELNLCGYCTKNINKNSIKKRVKREKIKKIKEIKGYKNLNITLRIREYTFNLFGYYPEMLPKKSQKVICRICLNCGKIEHVKYIYYNKAKNPNLCKSCIMKKLHQER